MLERFNYRIKIQKVVAEFQMQSWSCVGGSERRESACLADFEIIIQHRWDQNKRRNPHGEKIIVVG